MCKKGNIRVHKFVSNSAEFLQTIPESERGTKEIHGMEFPTNQVTCTTNERALGVQWNTKTDSLQFKLNLKDNLHTRRSILATVASIYDPLGLIAPTILTGKRILQQMCKEDLGWDDELQEELLTKWESWKASLDGLSQLTIPRCYRPEFLKKN